MNNERRDKTQLRQLLKMALITSPIIGIYTIIPIVLFIYSFHESKVMLLFWDDYKLFVAVLGITVVVFIWWLINIWLFNFLDKRIKKRVSNNWKYILSYSIIFAIVLILQSIRGDNIPIKIDAFDYYPFIGAFTNNTYILIIYWLVTNKHEKAQLELDKTRLELAQYVTQQEQLKNKIHPHFIFNALNTLNLLIKKEQQAAEDYLVRLSAYLRFSITETAKDKVLVKDEIEFCQNYIELQKVRFADSIKFVNNLPDDLINNEFLPVVTLQSLAENAIKHNAFTATNPLKMQLFQNDDKTITFSNNIIPKRNKEETTGTGLDNLKERFKLLGSNEPMVKQNPESNLFEVTFNTIRP